MIHADRSPTRLLVVTGSVPFSVDEEAFAQDEVTEMLRQGACLQVIPMRRRTRRANAMSRRSGLAAVSRPVALLSAAVVVGALATIVRHPIRTLRTLAITVRCSGSGSNLRVNLLSFPKALWLAGVARRWHADHIHAYWLSHTATAAMVAGSIARVPWSATGYRWDIDAANALKAKLERSVFLRCADELGKSQLDLAATHTAASEVVLVRTGVELPERDLWAGVPVDTMALCCPATMVEKKGHRVLLHAMATVRETYPDLMLDLFGDGPLRSQIEALVDELGLVDRVVFHGVVELDELRTHFRSRRPICVLPSIHAPDGQQEGIPVTLVEAMANGAPVLSTRSGSIESLVLPGTGVLVEPDSVEALVEGMLSVIEDAAAAEQRCHKAAERLVGEFDLRHTAARMIELTSG